METVYGWKQIGSANVIFVVPHGGDPVEAMIARAAEVLRPLSVSLVVNTKMRRRIVNFNNLDHLRPLPMRRLVDAETAQAFWADVETAVRESARVHSTVFVFCVHNAEPMLMRGSKIFPRRDTPDGALVYSELKHNDPRPYDLDIGNGQTGLLSMNGCPPEALTAPELAAAFCRNLAMAETIYPARGRGAVATFPAGKLFQLVCLAKSLQPDWRVEVGREFAAQKKNNLSQAIFQRFRNSGRVFTVQLEFLDTLPEKAVGEMLVELSVFH